MDFDHELAGTVRIKGTLVATDFPDGAVGAGVVVDAPFSVQRFAGQFHNGIFVGEVRSNREDNLVLLDDTLGVTGELNVNGNVNVLGDVRLLGADVAENFDLEGQDLGAGTVVVACGADRVRACSEPYDRRVAGVISGTDQYRRGLVLNAGPDSSGHPVALVGRVMCRAVAQDGPIAMGDLLTTSDVPGHAMRATDRDRSFGAVIGKSLGSLSGGRGMIPVLIALQ